MRVLISIRPFYGHFHPSVPLAAALRAARHEVAFATEQSFCTVIRKAGFDAFAAGLDPWAAAPWAEFSAQATGHKTEDLLAIARRWPPDTVLRDPTDFGPVIAAEVLDVPHATVGFSLFYPTSWWRQILGCSLDTVRREFDVVPDPGLERLYPWLYLDSVPPWFQRRYETLRDVVHLMRPEPFEAPHPQGPAAFESFPSGPTVLVTLGTVFNRRPDLLGLLCRGSALAGLNVLCTLGPGNEAALPLGDYAARVRTANYVPLSEVLPLCTAAVTHGGYNTVMTALLHGLPLLVVPLGADHWLNAERCVELGVGEIAPPEGLTEERVAELVRRLVEDRRFGRRASHFASRTAAVPGAEQAVALVERLGERRLGLS